MLAEQKILKRTGSEHRSPCYTAGICIISAFHIFVADILFELHTGMMMSSVNNTLGGTRIAQLLMVRTSGCRFAEPMSHDVEQEEHRVLPCKPRATWQGISEAMITDREVYHIRRVSIQRCSPSFSDISKNSSPLIPAITQEKRPPLIHFMHIPGFAPSSNSTPVSQAS